MKQFSLGDQDYLLTWVAQLLPTMEKFTKAAKGNPDIDFWCSFYKEGGGSGGPYINGYVLKLFPYFENYKGVKYGNDFQSKEKNFLVKS